VFRRVIRSEPQWITAITATVSGIEIDRRLPANAQEGPGGTRHSRNNCGVQLSAYKYFRKDIENYALDKALRREVA
jgi:hypothetical protein